MDVLNLFLAKDISIEKNNLINDQQNSLFNSYGFKIENVTIKENLFKNTDLFGYLINIYDTIYEPNEYFRDIPVNFKLKDIFLYNNLQQTANYLLTSIKSVDSIKVTAWFQNIFIDNHRIQLSRRQLSNN